MNQILATCFTVACFVAMVSCQLTGQGMTLSSSSGGIENYFQRVSGSQQAPGGQAQAALATSRMSMRRPRGGLGGLLGGPNMALMMGTGAELNDIMAFQMCNNNGMPMFLCFRLLN